MSSRMSWKGGLLRGWCQASHTVAICTITLAGAEVCLARATTPASKALALVWSPLGAPVIVFRRLSWPRGREPWCVRKARTPMSVFCHHRWTEWHPTCRPIHCTVWVRLCPGQPNNHGLGKDGLVACALGALRESSQWTTVVLHPCK